MITCGSAAAPTAGYRSDVNQVWRTLERIPTNPAANRVRGGHESTTVVTSEALLGKQRQISIIHNGERYTLRITANNKLILTK
jgi:hemin uptake protein HemP